MWGAQIWPPPPPPPPPPPRGPPARPRPPPPPPPARPPPPPPARAPGCPWPSSTPPTPPNARAARGPPWRPPTPPNARRAPGNPWRSSVTRRAPVRYAKAFFDLQLRFADRVATLSGLPLSRVLLEYTNLYIRFGLGRDFNASDPTWQAYLAGLKGPACIDEWTYDLYLTRHGSRSGPTVVATVGCFSYAPLSGECIRLHFHDADLDGQSPLAIERASRRRAELTGLFQHVKRTARTSF